MPRFEANSSDSAGGPYETEGSRSVSLERKRYCLDIARELYSLKVRDAFYSRNCAGPYPQLGPRLGPTGAPEPVRQRAGTH